MSGCMLDDLGAGILGYPLMEERVRPLELRARRLVRRLGPLIRLGQKPCRRKYTRLFNIRKVVIRQLHIRQAVAQNVALL
jgi:hypothetical protein